jgi:hypothetical protein
MRNTATAFVLAGLGALGLAGAPGPARTADVAEDIRRTADRLLLDESHRPDDALDALRRLIEIAAGVGREARLPAPVQAKLDAASAQARRLWPRSCWASSAW